MILSDPEPENENEEDQKKPEDSQMVKTYGKKKLTLKRKKDK